MPPRLFCSVLVPAVLLLGCARGGKRIEQAEVSGKVLYQGKPLPGGIIKFVGANGFVGMSPIDTDGSYKVEAPVGEVQISVDNRMLNRGGVRNKGPKEPPAAKMERPDRPQGGKAITGTYVPLPSQYTSPESSGLKYLVQRGPQTHDIELSAKPNQPPPPGP